VPVVETVPTAHGEERDPRLFHEVKGDGALHAAGGAGAWARCANLSLGQKLKPK
jgi:hypothetical protein